MSLAAPSAASIKTAIENPRLKTDTLAGSVAVLLVVTVFQRGIGFLRGILICRWLDPAELGRWDLAFGFLMLAAPVAVLGLTGSYGRYLEHYRQRGQLRTFLRRTGGCVFFLTLLSAAGVASARSWFSRFIFASPEYEGVVVLIALSLLAVIGFNFVFEIFGGLRLFRRVAAMQFFHSAWFAVLSVGLVLAWQSTATSLVIAFGAAYAICSICAIPWLRQTWRAMPAEETALGHPELWRKIVPFAASVWVTNWLANLFGIVDRWMLLHCSDMGTAAALVAVGNYHCACILPLPLLAIAALLRSALLPHLSHDWESQRRERVFASLNLALKLWGLLLLAVSAGLLLAAPWVFRVAFQGKYDGGLAVLPWTMMYIVWAAIATVASCYLWCAERAGWGSIAILAGLLANIALNLLFVPTFGLLGAVMATAAANLLTLIAIHFFNFQAGLKGDAGVWLVSAAPLSLLLGPMVAAAMTLAALHQAFGRNWLITAEEKQTLADMLNRNALTARLVSAVSRSSK